MKGKAHLQVTTSPEMSTIFNVFHVSPLRKCLHIPDEAIEPTNIKLQSDLTYEEKPI